MVVRSPAPFGLGWVEMTVGLPEGPSYPGHSPQQIDGPVVVKFCFPFTNVEKKEIFFTEQDKADPILSNPVG